MRSRPTFPSSSSQARGDKVAPQESEKDRLHKSIIRHHKALMRKLDLMHVDLCVATNAYNASQARQATHESAMLSLQQASEARKAQHEAAMLSLQEERVELTRQKLALLAQHNLLLQQQIALQQQAQKPTEPTSSTSRATGESTAPAPAG
ncbi:hypothetical protein XENTR_v10005599 [Xenopus tropicalis]|nr:hypothetical protein XENTR_v10005599 [Xenopus tropicalis]